MRLAAGALLLAPLGYLLLSAAAPSATPPPPALPPDCGSCSDHGEAIPPLSVAEFESLLRRYAQEPPERPGLALETLLFHGGRAPALLAGRESLLDAEHLAVLAREWRRRFARLEVRVVDEKGALRLRLDRAIPLDIKQHVHPQTVGFRPPEVSGTVRRVGLYHLWSRL